MDNRRLLPGTVIKTETRSQSLVTVKSFIASGGQGDVYEVEYCGEKRALKWYTCVFQDKKSFKENLKKNIEKGSPSKQFVWPLAITEEYNGTFGYVMELVPRNYYEVDSFLLSNVQFDSFRCVADACIKIVHAFRKLHGLGLVYQDLNGANFFIDPHKGDVKICDNDNVAPGGTSTGIIGTPGYIAPEVIIGEALPNMNTDKFSLSVLIFLLICMNHPLEGKRWVKAKPLTEKKAMKIYGYNPVFICDPDDDSNSPVPGTNVNVLERWKYLPDYLKEIFIKAFSKKSFDNPNARPSEVEWLENLCRFRAEIATCSCGRSDVFLVNGQTTSCDVCGTTFTVFYRIKLPEYSIALIDGSKIFRCQVMICKPENALEVIVRVVQKDEKTFGLKNKSNDVWTVTYSDGSSYKVEKDAMALAARGMTIQFNSSKDNILYIE